MATAKMSIAQEFIDDYNERKGTAEFAGRRLRLAQPYVAFAEGLMAGDAATFKAGYTADNAYLTTLDAFELTADEESILAGALGVGEQAKPEPMETCGCGATKPSECCAAVEGYFTSLGQRSDEELTSLADGDGCTAAKGILVERAAHDDRLDDGGGQGRR